MGGGGGGGGRGGWDGWSLRRGVARGVGVGGGGGTHSYDCGTSSPPPLLEFHHFQDLACV